MSHLQKAPPKYMATSTYAHRYCSYNYGIGEKIIDAYFTFRFDRYQIVQLVGVSNIAAPNEDSGGTVSWRWVRVILRILTYHMRLLRCASRACIVGQDVRRDIHD